MFVSRWRDVSVHTVRPETTRRGLSGYLLGKLPVWLRLTLFGFCLSPVLLRSISQSFLDLTINRLVGDVIGPVGLLLKIFLAHAKQIPAVSRCSY